MLGVALIGEAREVHNAFLKDGDPTKDRHPEARRNRRAEERRVVWREYRRDQASWATHRAAFELRRAPDRPHEEREDIKNFFDALSKRYVMSTTANLAALNSFQVLKGETTKVSVQDSMASSEPLRRRNAGGDSHPFSMASREVDA